VFVLVYLRMCSAQRLSLSCDISTASGVADAGPSPNRGRVGIYRHWKLVNVLKRCVKLSWRTSDGERSHRLVLFRVDCGIRWRRFIGKILDRYKSILIGIRGICTSTFATIIPGDFVALSLPPNPSSFGGGASRKIN
jgi:hypothetical protein